MCCSPITVKYVRWESLRRLDLSCLWDVAWPWWNPEDRRLFDVRKSFEVAGYELYQKQTNVVYIWNEGTHREPESRCRPTLWNWSSWLVISEARIIVGSHECALKTSLVSSRWRRSYWNTPGQLLQATRIWHKLWDVYCTRCTVHALGCLIDSRKDTSYLPQRCISSLILKLARFWTGFWPRKSFQIFKIQFEWWLVADRAVGLKFPPISNF